MNEYPRPDEPEHVGAAPESQQHRIERVLQTWPWHSSGERPLTARQRRPEPVRDDTRG